MGRDPWGIPTVHSLLNAVVFTAGPGGQDIVLVVRYAAGIFSSFTWIARAWQVGGAPRPHSWQVCSAVLWYSRASSDQGPSQDQ